MGVFHRAGCFEKVSFVVPVSPLEMGANRVRGLDGWPEESFQRNITVQVTLMESALELCRNGMAAAFLPAFIARLHNKKVLPSFRLVKHPAPLKLKKGRTPVYLVKRKADLESRNLKAVASALRSIE